MAEGPVARPLGLVPLLALGINGVVGVGIFFAPSAVAAELPGLSGVGAYAITALALLPIAASYSALGSRYQVDGGPAVWAEAAFGPRVSFFVGWLTFVSSLFSLAAVVSGLARHASPLFGVASDGGVRAFAVGCTLVLAVLAASGLRPSSFVWTAVTALKLTPLLALVVVGLALFSSVTPAPPPPPDVLTPHSFGRAVLVVVFACQGFEIVPLLAGSAQRPARSVPIATVGSLVFAGGLYCLLHALAVRAVPNLGASHAPLADAARVYGGPFAAAVVQGGANVSALGIAFGMLNTTPRYLSALSGPSALGSWIGAIDVRLVPQRALVVTVLATLVMLFLASGLSDLFVLSSLAVLAQFGASIASLAVLSRRGERGLSPRHLVLVAASAVGIFLVARGAEARQAMVAVGVVGFGEVLRLVVQRQGRGGTPVG